MRNTTRKTRAGKHDLENAIRAYLVRGDLADPYLELRAVRTFLVRDRREVFVRAALS